MFEKFTGRAFLYIHGSLGLLCFAYLCAVNVMKYADNHAVLAGRRLVSEAEKDMIMEEQMKSASRISVMFSSAFFFGMSVVLMSHQTEMNFGVVQRSVMGKRLDFCMTLSLYISFFSALFNAIQLMDDDNLNIMTLHGDSIVLDLGRPVEWMLTCPLMQLAVPILAGEKIPDSRRTSMPLLAFTVLTFGLLSTIASDVALKALMYCGGFLCFLFMCAQMNACVMDASCGGESLLSGSSFLRGLVVIIALTWIPFPIWYALSPEGFDIIQDAAGMKVAVAFLNVFSKGSFMMYLARIRTDHNTRQKTLVAVGYIDEKGVTLAKDANKDACKSSDVDNITCMLVKEVLECMGRSKDTDNVLAGLERHLITNNDDILALTKEYCAEINLPWGLILALKSKIRSYNIQLGDAWSMQFHNEEALADVTVSLSAPHIARNKEKIEHVVRRQNSKDLASIPSRSRTNSKDSNLMDFPSGSRTNSKDSNHMPIEETTSDRISTSGLLPPTGQSPSSVSSDDGINKMTDLLEDHQEAVNRQVDECRDFVRGQMDKIIEALDQRMIDQRTTQNNSGQDQALDVPLASSAILAEPAI
jgi:bacteriorhodopsin